MKKLWMFMSVGLMCIGCEGPQGPAGPAGSGGVESLVDPAVQPRVIYSFPVPLSVGPYPDGYPSITLRFNKIMNTGSMRQSIVLSSPTTQDHVDTNSISSVGGDIWTFFPARQASSYWMPRWKVGETYAVRVLESARDINGNPFTPEFEMTFTPEPHFRVRSISPSDGAVDVSVSSSVYLDFNSKIDTNTLSSIQFDPTPNGEWIIPEYYDSTQAIFVHSSPYLLEQTYSVLVGSNARDKDGNQIVGPFNSTFTTQPFRVLNSYPSNNARNVARNLTSIYVSCNVEIDTGSVRSAFSAPGIQGTFAFGTYFFNYNISVPLAPNTAYTYSLSTALRSKSGAYLPAPYSVIFTTEN